MPPRAPQVRQGPKTRGTTARLPTHSTDLANAGAGWYGPRGQAGSLGAAAAALGSASGAALELLKHASNDRVEDGCKLSG